MRHSYEINKDMLTDLPKDLISFLRYAAPPLVGIGVVSLFDSDHNIIQVINSAFQPSASGANASWSIVTLLVVVGVATFSLHRAVFMHAIGRFINRCLTRKRGGHPSLDELDFSRWRRRVAPIETPERGAQAVLDQANAAVDFFYCCTWNSLVFLVVVRLAAWPALSLSQPRWYALAGVLAIFLLIGIWSHFETSRRDLVAYDRFDGLHKNLLRAMLKDSRFPEKWRKLDTLQHVVGLDVDATKRSLLEIGARASEDGQDLWGLLEYHPLPGPDA